MLIIDTRKHRDKPYADIQSLSTRSQIYAPSILDRSDLRKLALAAPNVTDVLLDRRLTQIQQASNPIE